MIFYSLNLALASPLLHMVDLIVSCDKDKIFCELHSKHIVIDVLKSLTNKYCVQTTRIRTYKNDVDGKQERAETYFILREGRKSLQVVPVRAARDTK